MLALIYDGQPITIVEESDYTSCGPWAAVHVEFADGARTFVPSDLIEIERAAC